MRPVLVASAAAAVAVATSAKCGLRSMTNLVTFGDSLTDEARILYFMENDGQAPPPGTRFPPNNQTLSGGYAWGRLVANLSGAEYYNYGVGGATCSYKIATKSFAGYNWTVPTVLEYQVPAFQKDLAVDGMFPNRKPDNTVYALWIGANDLGWGAFLSDSMVPGATLPDIVDCMWNSFDGVYKTGGRHFVVLNMLPLEHAPVYSPSGLGGRQHSQYWPGKAEYNVTQYNSKLRQYATSVNTMIEQGGLLEHTIKKRWPGVSLTVFDVNALLKDILEDPGAYLSYPANATGVYHSCPGESATPEDCVDSSNPLSSFFWYDDLHPTERVVRIIAETFIKVVERKSKYGYYCG